GSYTVTEDESTAGIANYDLTVSGDNKVAKTVVKGETTKVAITNTYKSNTTPTTGSLEITKTLATGYPSAASSKVFSFTVTGPDNYKETVTITGAGKATLDNLEPGSYTVTEDETGAAIAEYDLTVSGDNGKSKTVAAGETTKVEITNTYKKQSTGSDLEVTFEKKDEKGKLIAKAELTLKSLDGFDMSNVYVMQGGKKVTPRLSTDKTAISFDTVDTAPSIVCGLKAGDYSLTETVTPKKYETADEILFTLYNDGTNNITVSGSPIVMIDKADPNYKPDDSDVISANRKPVPATGEEISLTSIIGVALICTCAVSLAGLGIYRIKRKRS
ncbi:MAG: hypothetical protein J6Z02_03525, partial [Lachnospiraceae bacterium]|nr:hypothetical protein [Lachnospiraceae bacterium]